MNVLSADRKGIGKTNVGCVIPKERGLSRGPSKVPSKLNNEDYWVPAISNWAPRNPVYQ